MQNLICCLKEKESFIRITGHFKDYTYINFEEYVSGLDEVKNMSPYRSWQYAVVDKNLKWGREVASFFNKLSVPVIYFDDDYEQVIKSIKTTVPESAAENAESRSSEMQDSKLKPVEKIRYIERQKVIEKKVYTGIEKKTVLITNLTKCAGSTTLTLNLAKYLSNLKILSAIIEPPIDHPTLFHWMGIEDRLSNGKDSSRGNFYSYPHEISKNKILKPDSEYIFDNIAWIVPDDRREKIEDWNYNQMIKLVYASSLCPITFIDIGSSTDHGSVKQLLSNIDIILVVADPFPTYCMRVNHRLEEFHKLKEEGFPIHFVINKWNSGVKEKDFLSYLGCKPAAFIPAINLDCLYKANYSSSIPYSYGEVSKVLEEPLGKILSLFVKEKFLKRPTSNQISRSILSRLKKFSYNIVNFGKDQIEQEI